MSTTDVIFVDAVNEFGPEAQIDMAIEECAELIKALLKYKRKQTPETVANVKEELADNKIMSKQMQVIFGSFAEEEKQKLSRLAFRLETGRWNHEKK